MAADIWTLVHAERTALADDLTALTTDQWSTPSLCEGWTVEQVLAHQVSTARTSALGFFSGLVKAGFSFDRFTDNGVKEGSKGGSAAVLAGYRDIATSTKAPPGPKVSWLGEELIHGEDIRRPLGLTRDYPAAAVVPTLDFYKGSNMIVGAKKRIAGLSLKATDADWSHGTGDLVSGPAISLLMAMTGRKEHLADLSGPGVEVLRNR